MQAATASANKQAAHVDTVISQKSYQLLWAVSNETACSNDVSVSRLRNHARFRHSLHDSLQALLASVMVAERLQKGIQATSQPYGPYAYMHARPL